MKTLENYKNFFLANQKNATIAVSIGFFIGISLFYLMLKKPCGCADKKETKPEDK